MLPPVLEQRLVHQFNYWRNGLQLGMRHGSELYSHVRSYALQDRLDAYALACDMAEQGQVTCITRSSEQYDIWVTLRSMEEVATPAQPVELKPRPTSMDSYRSRRLIGQQAKAS